MKYLSIRDKEIAAAIADLETAKNLMKSEMEGEGPTDTTEVSAAKTRYDDALLLTDTYRDVVGAVDFLAASTTHTILTVVEVILPDGTTYDMGTDIRYRKVVLRSTTVSQADMVAYLNLR